MITFIDPGKLYTQEIFVYGEGVDTVDISRPVSVVRDPNGDYAVTDGNHRAKKALINGKKLPVNVIGTIKETLKKNPDFRKIKDLSVKPRQHL